MINIIIAIIVLTGIIFLLIWSTKSMLKQSMKDWETLRDLEERVEKISNMEELITFHKEFLEKGNRIYNKYITPRLSKIDGYCRGLHKAFKNNKL